MRILLVSHSFPPRGTAGTETYTAELGLELARRGHEVHIFASAKDVSLKDLSLVERDWRGLAVHEIVNNLYYGEFRETWDHAGIDRVFGALLDRLAPEVVHFQHLMYLSAGCVEAVHERGVTIVFTLHDFWLECPRFGQRVHADGGVCDVIDFGRCGTCLTSFDYAQGNVAKAVGGMIAHVRAGTGIDLGPLAREARDVWARGARDVLAKRTKDARGREADAPDVRGREADAPSGSKVEHVAGDADALRAAAQTRSSALQQRVVPCVDLFLAPSRFLRERFVREWHVPAEKIEYLRFGIDGALFGARARSRSGKLRVAFIGSLVRIKGAHVLLDAWGILRADLRENSELVLYGPARHEPRYQHELEASAKTVGARLAGALDRKDVARVLASTDLLVVPSVWFENAPLVIAEALASKTPLLVSDAGGMAELVERGTSGYHFKMGDSADLARELARAIEEPARLSELYRRPVELPTFAEHVDRVLEHYAAAKASRTARGGAR